MHNFLQVQPPSFRLAFTSIGNDDNDNVENGDGAGGGRHIAGTAVGEVNPGPPAT